MPYGHSNNLGQGYPENNPNNAQAYAPTGAAPNSYNAQGYAPTGAAPNNNSAQGYVPPGAAPNSYSAQGYVPPGAAPNSNSAQGYAPAGAAQDSYNAQDYTQAQQPAYGQNQGTGTSGEDINDGKLGNIFGRDVAMDLKARLKPPSGENSAEVQGKYSVYRFTATKSVPGAKVTVMHNVSPEVIEKIKEVSGRYAYTKPTEQKPAVLSVPGLQNLTTGYQAALYALNALLQRQNPYPALTDAIGLITNAMQSLTAENEQPDFYLKEIKVQPKTLPDGYSKVTTIEIQRLGTRKGKPSNYPWIISIENFEAIKVVDEVKRTTTYNAKTKRPGKWGGAPITVFASDADIFRLASRAMRYQSVWDIIANSNIIKRAIKLALRND